MNEQLQIQCGPVVERGQRVVIATLGEISHRDRFDIDSEFHRCKFRERVIHVFGLGDDAHEWIETSLIQAADREDEGGGSFWEPIVTRLSEVEAVAPDLLWPGRMATKTLSCIDGDGGVGKGLMMIDLAARGSRGDAMPPDNAPDGTFDSWSTFFITSEDSPEFILSPRAQAAGANLDRIITMSSVEIPESDKRSVALLQDVELIGRVVMDNGVRLVVVDPYSEFIDPHLNMNSDPDNRKCLGPLSEMAQRTGAAVVLVRHLNKKEGQSAQYRGVGSTAPLNASRAAFLIAPDPADADLRVLACTKFNIGPKPPSLRYRIEAAGTTARVRWEGECELTAAELLKSANPNHDGKLERATVIITDVLSAGPRGENEVRMACEDAGISTSTYKRARKELGIESEKTGFQGEWLLSLPPSANGVCHDEF